MATDERLLYEAHTIWAENNECKALYLVIEGHNREIFLCWEDDKDLAFWQAVGRLWERAPLMQLRLKDARDAIASLPPDALGVTGFADFISDMDEDGNLREGVQYDTTCMYTGDLLLGNIERALEEDKGE